MAESRFEQVAHAHGTYYHLFTAGAPVAICGLARPIWAAAKVGKRPLCPNCRAERDTMAEALRVAPGPAAQAKLDEWKRRNPNFARMMTHPLIGRD